MKKNKTWYYLDTCAIISLDDKLLENRIKKNCFFSSFTIIELCRNINEKTYSRQKRLLDIIAESGIAIDWQRKKAIISEYMFRTPLKGNTFHRNDKPARVLFDIVKESTSYSDYLALKNQNSIKIFLDEFTPREFRNIYKKNPEFKKKFKKKAIDCIDIVLNDTSRNSDDITIQLLDGVKERHPAEGYDNFIDYFKANYRTLNQYLIGSYADYIADHFEYTGEKRNKIYKNYNNKAGIYNTTLVYYLLEHAYNNEEIKKHDGLDIDHLLFILKPNTIIVSSDNDLLSLIETTDQGYCLHLNEFELLMGLID